MEALTLPKAKMQFGNSVGGFRWEFSPVDERTALALSQQLELPDIVARILASRRITTETAEKFLTPSLREYLPDPLHLLDMKKAADRIAQAVINQEKIVVFGDYDVDGATSSALLKRFFRMIGLEVSVYIPDRIKEGYGPNTDAMLQLKKEGADIVITVDCGAVSHEPLAAAKKAGLEVIVIDHHLGTAQLPEAVAVVNPNRLDETSPHRNMAAVGVAFLLAVAVNTALRGLEWYKTHKQPDLLSLLDLVALGTVCDVMTLTGVNRAFVTQGLKVMAKRHNAGLSALADVAGVQEMPGVYHLGFVLGPRINAGGRVGEAPLGTRLLSCDDYDEAYKISQRLDRFNAERKTIEILVLDEAMVQAEQQYEAGEAVIFVKGEGWHPGVIGIVASRIKEKYNRPVAVLALENGVGKASARSISGVDLGAAVTSAKEEGYLVAGGGHAMAAGFTVLEDKIEALQRFFSTRLSQGVAEHGAYKKLMLHGVISVASATTGFLKQLAALEPYGVGHAEPRFVLANVHLLRVSRVGENHLRCIIRDNGAKGKTITAMAFRSVDTPLGDVLLNGSGKSLNLAGKLRLNAWQGVESIQFLVDDVSF